MDDFPTGTRSIFARAIAAEIRAVMAARRITGRTLAKEAGFASHNYVAMRLRDEKPFTLDDVEAICDHLDEETDAFLQRAYANHSERLWSESLREKRRAQASEASARVGALVQRLRSGEDPNDVLADANLDGLSEAEAQLFHEELKAASRRAAAALTQADVTKAARHSKSAGKKRHAELEGVGEESQDDGGIEPA